MAVAEYKKEMDPSKEGNEAELGRLKEKEKESYDKTHKGQSRIDTKKRNDNHAEAKMAVAEYKMEMDPSKEGDVAVLEQLKEKEKETHDKTKKGKQRTYQKKMNDNHAEAKMAVAEYEKKMDPSNEGDVAVLERLKEKEKETHDKTKKGRGRNANTIGGRSIQSNCISSANRQAVCPSRTSARCLRVWP